MRRRKESERQSKESERLGKESERDYVSKESLSQRDSATLWDPRGRTTRLVDGSDGIGAVYRTINCRPVGLT